MMHDVLPAKLNCCDAENTERNHMSNNGTGHVTTSDGVSNGGSIFNAGQRSIWQDNNTGTSSADVVLTDIAVRESGNPVLNR